MALTIEITSCNKIKVTNNGVVNATIIISKLQSSGSYLDINTTPLTPIPAILPNGSYTTPVLIDGFYKVTEDLATDVDYYVPVTCSIDKCEKNLIIDLLCAKDDCATTDKLELRRQLKFRALKTALSYLVKGYVESQSSFIMTNPPVADMIYLADLFTQLLSICSCYDNATMDGNTTDCGCGK